MHDPDCPFCNPSDDDIDRIRTLGAFVSNQGWTMQEAFIALHYATCELGDVIEELGCPQMELPN